MMRWCTCNLNGDNPLHRCLLSTLGDVRKGKAYVKSREPDLEQRLGVAQRIPEQTVTGGASRKLWAQDGAIWQDLHDTVIRA